MRIPFPTPAGVIHFTLQAAVAILVALLLTPVEALIIMVVYGSLGLAGFPVFSDPSFIGVSYLFSPAFGYLIGFTLSAPVGSLYLNRKLPVDAEKSHFGHHLAASLIVVMLIFVCGLTYTWGYFRYIMNAPIALAYLLPMGIAVLWIKDLLLAIIIATVALRLRSHIS
jgi:biotin transport system substrate-specific component